MMLSPLLVRKYHLYIYPERSSAIPCNVMLWRESLPLLSPSSNGHITSLIKSFSFYDKPLHPSLGCLAEQEPKENLRDEIEKQLINEFAKSLVLQVIT